MVRLIDVALLVLLGFIAISRLKTEYVALPSGGETAMQPLEQHIASLHVYPEFFELVDHGRRWDCSTLDELEALLTNQQQRFLMQQIKYVINIEPHRASLMQRLVDVLDVCHRNKIDKNLNYESIN
jgi:biopolymer transport protein ExbD